ncbi:MAG: hypothetical protein GX442_24730 [Candidatus Riflebacteria bacterium]|nr:hypothetical protein [Candidatus Riflebacteria bacterium]
MLFRHHQAVPAVPLTMPPAAPPANQPPQATRAAALKPTAGAAQANVPGRPVECGPDLTFRQEGPTPVVAPASATVATAPLDQARFAVGPDGRLILPDGPPPPPVAPNPGLPPDRKPS